jgi:hypothetical protein
MAKLSISDAARSCRVARSTLQRAINAGRLGLDPDHRIDTAELIRAGDTLHAARQEDGRRVLHGALQDAAPHSTNTRQDTAGAVQSDVALMQQTIAALERENTWLRAALDAAATREQDARAHAQASGEERALLLQMLQEMQHRYDRLLDMPRTTPPARPASRTRLFPPGRERTRGETPPARLSPATCPVAPLEDPRGAMRRRIVALLQEHPEGLTPAEMRPLLGVDKSLADTCLGMLRYGLVQRVERGRYVAAAPSRNER